MTRVAAVGGILAATGVAAGAGATTGPQVTSTTLTYTCAFPSGTQPVTTHITATFPATAKTGQPIQPTGASVTVTLPATQTSHLAKEHATSVTATASLGTATTWTGGSAASTWAALAAPATQVPAKGTLALTATGTVPPVTVTAAGTASVSAAALSLVLTPHVTASGVMTRAPAAINAQCTPTTGQNTTLVTIPISGSTITTPPTKGAGSQAKGAPTKYCPKLLKPLKMNPRWPWPPYPKKGSSLDHSPGVPPYCVYITGFADVRKLNGAALLGPALSNLSAFLNSIFNFEKNYFQQDSVGELSFHNTRQFPPATATLLGFGFMPTTATLQLSELGTLNVYTVGPLTACTGKKCQPTITTAWARLQIRIYNVNVNGTPLNVGQGCETPPFDVKLTGSSATTPPYQFSTGGPLTGSITIPNFTGCGVGENLDPLFSGVISGPGNYSLLTQGVVCEQSQFPLGCPPKKPVPLRHITG